MTAKHPQNPLERILERNTGIPRSITFTIHGELCDLNTYITAERSNRFIASKIKKEETERVAWEAKAAGLRPVTEYPVYLTYRWYSKNNRKDLDNTCFSRKFVQDGLVQAGVLKGDGRKYVAGFADHFFIDKVYPRVEVEIITHSLATRV